MKQFCVFIALLFILGSCNKVKQKTKETINEGGEVIGKTATEFVEGVSEGVDQTLECTLDVSAKLKEKGISTGKYSILKDSTGSQKNLLVVYIIFNNDFNNPILAKVFNKEGLETGRKKIDVSGAPGDAKYFDFQFEKRTDIEHRSKITLE
jgi:hypothetical protein